MSADEDRPEDEWPLPPVWMWGCHDCAVRYRSMKRAQELVEERRLACGPGVDHDPMDSIVGTQIALAEHMAAAHAAQLTDWVPSCPVCSGHQQAIATEHDGSARARALTRIGNEHRARHVFAPPRIVGLY
ncbi:hypothetical protein QNO07_25035 [Streptomyces sp. 549]|uniref:hypothetical protein n=1 Tax=Streptomyces sp. 549 TaxID=3049076 RepID=UPI0024C376B3|nr:hypothetical protein [Streptomyces sp. 549]MDK1476629.1 hypothetical protein [Streptomyces sp. 549]